MDRKEYEFLDDVLTCRKHLVSKLSPADTEMWARLSCMGYLDSVTGRDIRLTTDGRTAMQDYLRTADSRNLQQRSVAAQEKSAEELARLRLELDQLRAELADFKKQQADQHASDSAQAKRDLRKLNRHDLFVAAFTVVFPIALQVVDAAGFFELIYISVASLFK